MALRVLISALDVFGQPPFLSGCFYPNIYSIGDWVRFRVGLVVVPNSNKPLKLAAQ
jgi:hypothetical protein